jgi:hypothetical protein
LILAAVVSGIIAVMTTHKTAIITAAGCAMLIIPVAGSYGIEKPKPRKAMFIYSGVMGILLILAILISLFGLVGYEVDRLFPFWLDCKCDQSAELNQLDSHRPKLENRPVFFVMHLMFH